MTDQPDTATILLASVALEPNRWKKDELRVPSLRISEWGERAAEAGFDGWELWERHYFLADASERAALTASALPVVHFNTYLRPGLDSLDDWKRVVEAVTALGPQVRGIKFNLGSGERPVFEQVAAAVDWADYLPENVRMLCECHPGTVLETPDAAREAFRIWPAGRFGAILHPMNRDPGHCDAWFGALEGRIEHLHWQARDAENRVCGLADMRDALSVVENSLRKHAYTGMHAVEFVRGTGQPGESVDGLFEAAIDDLKVLRSAQLGL
jgi:sugar phosphate isomerase/epimerase